MIVSQGLTVIATSLAAVLIARKLEPSDWGVFSAFLGLSFALAVFVEFGLATWLLRELSRLFVENGEAADNEARVLVATAAVFAIVVAITIVVAGTGAGAVAGERASLVVALSSLLCYGGLFALANILEPYLRAQRRLGRIVTASILEKYVLVMLVVIAATQGAGIWELGLAYLVAGLLRVSLLYWSVFGGSLPRLPTSSDLRSVLRKSLPFALTSGAFTVVPRLDALCLLALSTTAAGYFALGDRMLGPLAIASAIAATTLYPFLAQRAHRSRAVWGLSFGLGVCGGIAAAAGFLTAPTLVPLLFGHQYEAAVPAMRLMFLALPLVYAASPLLVYSFSYERERAVVGATLIAMLTGTGAILIGQALEGISGAAAGFLLRQALVFGALVAIAATATRREAPQSQLPLASSIDAPVP
jgi:O-antigen/teichoic acid export membrane protein